MANNKSNKETTPKTVKVEFVEVDCLVDCSVSEGTLNFKFKKWKITVAANHYEHILRKFSHGKTPHFGREIHRTFYKEMPVQSRS